MFMHQFRITRLSVNILELDIDYWIEVVGLKKNRKLEHFVDKKWIKWYIYNADLTSFKLNTPK